MSELHQRTAKEVNNDTELSYFQKVSVTEMEEKKENNKTTTSKANDDNKTCFGLGKDKHENTIVLGEDVDKIIKPTTETKDNNKAYYGMLKESDEKITELRADTEGEYDERREEERDVNRYNRYVDTDSEMYKCKTFYDFKPFYNGDTLELRLREMRRSMSSIRLNWDNFDIFLESLRTLFLEEGVTNFENETTKRLVDRLISVKRDWLEADDVNKRDVSYDAVKVYTSTEGYNAIYGLCNRIFRQDDSVKSEERLRNAVFLVELINVDLYNYCLKYPDKANFQGVVYRGQTVTQDDLEAFRSVKNYPIDQRNIAIPLGLLSSTPHPKVAKKFIIGLLDKQSKSGDTKMMPMLYKIHVIGLSQNFIEIYKSVFPSVVMTTICAVDIQNLSRHPEESEVLLRGPFFLVLDIYQDENFLDDRPCDVIEAVMMNTNRDHKTVAYLSKEEDFKARELKAYLVGITRSEFAAKFCAERGLHEDESKYRKLITENQEKLKLFLES